MQFLIVQTINKKHLTLQTHHNTHATNDLPTRIIIQNKFIHRHFDVGYWEVIISF
jgi:hypothetical protein